MTRKTNDSSSSATAAPAGEANFDDPRIAREWALQERAQREERAGVPMNEDDEQLAQYRLLTRALRAPAMEPIPYGFAEQIARRVESAADNSDRVESYLQRGLLGVLVVSGVVTAGSGIANSLSTLQAHAPQGSLSWGALIGACCLLTWGWDRAARAIGLDTVASHRAA